VSQVSLLIATALIESSSTKAGCCPRSPHGLLLDHAPGSVQSMIELPVPPTLSPPSRSVKASYLLGEQADMLHRESDTSWLAAASRDFDGFVAERAGVRERWGVPSELFWYTSNEYYIGSLVIRHELSVDEGGGHIGYHVVYPWQRQGHATRMLREALGRCSALGIGSALLTVAPENVPSLKVVDRCGGIADGVNEEGELRFWIDTSTSVELVGSGRTR